MGKNAQRNGKTLVFPWGRWLALYCAFSFAMLGVDAAMNHYEVIHENPWSWTPLIFAPIAVIVALVSTFSLRWRLHVWILGVLGLIVGIAGTLFHDVPTVLQHGHRTVWQALLSTPRPVLAPAAFAATSLLLLLISWGERWQRRRLQVSTPREV